MKKYLLILTAVSVILISCGNKNETTGYIPEGAQAKVYFINSHIEKTIEVVLDENDTSVNAIFSNSTLLNGSFAVEYKHLHPDYNQKKVPVIVHLEDGQYYIDMASKPH